MKRSFFVIGSAAACLIPGTRVLSASASTIVAVNCSEYNLQEECTDMVAGALRERGVTTVAPEAIDVTIRERLTVEVQRWFGGGVINMSYVASVARRYNAARVLLVDARLYSSSLPYGDFTVYSTRASCSYRCFNVGNKTIIAAGVASGEDRGEDQDMAEHRALSSAALSLARSAAPKIIAR